MRPPERAVASRRLRSILICHADSRLNREGVARWLASFTDLAAIVLIDERGRYTRVRVRNEIKRIGVLRFVDVMAFRLYYAVRLARTDRRWLERALEGLANRYPDPPSTVEIFRTADPNSLETEAVFKRLAHDLMIVRCKRILKERIFEIPRHGTFVLHPGVCPEYRNAHGAFWALANRDLANVGLTLLKIDRGVDTGPVFGYYSYDFDEVNESHIVIMTRLVLENLDAIRERLLAICAGETTALDTRGRRSAAWGQPWLTRYLRWKRDAKRRQHAGVVARVP
jgi:Formyl transferase